ncbi:MAG: PAS domain-containing protein [Microthrixaceae bacterium]
MSPLSPNAESWRELLQRAPTAVVVADEHLRCLFVSDAAERLTGRTRRIAGRFVAHRRVA